ncbi:MAG TPA: hypothetical protein VM735_10470 [Candidatus Kapabacteria bacterium]|nr:hypothetical protein [Candidatus Kapabacteria bacterium]
MFPSAREMRRALLRIAVMTTMMTVTDGLESLHLPDEERLHKSAPRVEGIFVIGWQFFFEYFRNN